MWFDDGNRTVAVADWYFISGEFKTLNNPALVQLGVKARRAAFTTIGTFVVWGTFVSISQATPSFSCLLGMSSS